MTEKCYHCGSEVHNDDYVIQNGEEKLYFCCNGCKQAYIFIQNIGYGSYYLKREEYAEKPKDNVELSIFDFIEKELPLQQDGNQQYKTANFYLKGLHCASCVWLNEKVVSSIEGVLDVNVSFSANRIFIKWDPSVVSLKEIVQNIYRIGYEVLPIDETVESPLKTKSDKLLKKMAVAGFFTGNNMLISVSLYAGYFDYIDPVTKQFFHYVSFLFATPVFFYSAKEFFQSAYQSLKHRILGMDVLTSAGISLAYFYSIFITFTHQVDKEVFFDAVCFIVFAILTGRFIESRLKLRSYYFTTNLISLLPGVARKLKNYSHLYIVNDNIFVKNELSSLDEKDYEFLKVDFIEKGDVILVYPNEIVPLDGILLNKEIELEESSLTGEFKPILKYRKDFIVSGAKNISPVVMFLKVENTKKESMVVRIIQLAEESIKNKSKSEELAGKAAAIFVGLVLFLSGITFLYWYVFKQDLPNAILYTISTLIVACPCALSLSIPTAILAGVQKLYSWGCLIKNSTHLDTLHRAKVIAFDKTGTLTEGKFQFREIISFVPAEVLWQIVKLMNETQRKLLVQHPVAGAFISLENRKDTQLTILSEDSLDDIITTIQSGEGEGKYHIGSGVEVFLPSMRFHLGSRAWLQKLGYPVEKVKDDLPPGVTEVLLGAGTPQKKTIIAGFYLEDTLRKGAEQVIRSLKPRYTTILLTGDNLRNAEWIQKKLGLDKVYHSLKPEDKAEIIRDYQKKAKVIMVGDGINDTIALRQADVGISFAEASKLALYSTDILLLKSDTGILSDMLELSHFVVRKIKQNLFLSLVYNTFLLPLAMVGFLNPFVGSIFMSLSSITVVSNSLTILKFRSSRQS